MPTTPIISEEYISGYGNYIVHQSGYWEYIENGQVRGSGSSGSTPPHLQSAPSRPAGGGTTSQGNPNTFSIGGVSFKAVEIIDLEGTRLIPEHALEDQYTVQDHIFDLPKIFKITIALDRDENEHIKFSNLLNNEQKVFPVSTPIEYVEAMAISSYKLQLSDSENILYASFTLTEIRKAIATFTQGAGYTGEIIPTNTELPAHIPNEGTSPKTTLPPPDEKNDLLGNIFNIATKAIPVVAAFATPPLATVTAARLVATSLFGGDE